MCIRDRAGAVYARHSQIIVLSVIITASFGVGISFSIGYPLTALTFEAWQQPAWLIGLAGSAPALGVLLTLPLIPRIIHKLGAAGAMVAGYAIGAIGFASLYMVPHPWAWILIRLAMNGGLAIPWLTSETWINAVSPDRLRGRIIAVYAIAFFLGFAIGPLLLKKAGIEGYLPFAIAGAVTALCAMPVWLARKTAPEFTLDPDIRVRSAFLLAPSSMVGGFLVGFIETVSVSLLPVFALNRGLGQEATLGLLSAITFGGVFLQIPIGYASDRYSKGFLMIGLAASLALELVLFPVVLNSALLALILAFVIGGSAVGVYTLALGMIGEEVDRNALPAANAMFLVLYEVGALTGPVITGLAMTASPKLGYTVSSVAALVLTIPVLVILQRRKHAARP